MWDTFLQAVGLMLVIEGIFPFIYPGRWRSLVVQLATIPDNQLRWGGLITMIVGVCLLIAMSN